VSSLFPEKVVNVESGHLSLSEEEIEKWNEEAPICTFQSTTRIP